MDMQALTTINQINQRKKPTRPLKAILRTIKGISIEGALAIMEAFGYSNEIIYVNGVKQFTDNLANDFRYPELQGRMAEETMTFWFWGGPPNKLHWYTGTLYTLLLDRLLCEIDVNGINHVAEWIGIDEC